MKQGALRILQEILTETGRYFGPITGQLTDELPAAVDGMIEDRKADLTAPPANWSDKRKRVAAFQLACADAECDPGPVDGLWGQLTDYAYLELEHLRRTGEPLLKFRDIVPGDGNPNQWPTDRPGQAELMDFFSYRPKKGTEPPTVIVDCPWQLTLDFDHSAKTRRIGCHPKVADSLSRILNAIHAHYGTDALREMGMHMYGGCKAVRTKRGGSTWSTHSWAAAVDWDPSKNQLEWGWQKAHMARTEFLKFWEIWEAEGWVSLGRERNFDWMHIQAIKLP